MKKENGQKGITLVALVITIIILLILAGISIATLGGENGLFTRAKQAKSNTLDAQNAENQALTGYETKIDEVVGGSGGGATGEAGKTDSSKNRSLADATTGYTYKNPVIPQGFNAVDTDSAKWEYTDAEKTTVRGWNEGLVIEDVYNQNQFVWVPCTTSATTDTVAYERRDGNAGCSDATDSTTENAVTYNAIPVTESTQIGTYGGFYVARYEAGLPTETTSQSSDLNNVYTSVPVSKKGSKIWNHVDYTHSYVAANKMVNDTTKYGNNKSGLITGKQWDTIMAWYKNAGIGVEASTQNWGTYRSLTYSGTGLNFTEDYYLVSSWTTGGFSHTGTTTSSSSDSPSHYHASGLNSNGIKKNIADLGGNVWEWTAEVYAKERRLLRGGKADGSAAEYPSAYRNWVDRYQNWCSVGFRSVLYVQ